MTDTLPQRPTFSNGQYIGADDLNAEVDYARDKTERLALSTLSWGIATGLALVEIADATGATANVHRAGHRVGRIRPDHRRDHTGGRNRRPVRRPSVRQPEGLAQVQHARDANDRARFPDVRRGRSGDPDRRNLRHRHDRAGRRATERRRRSERRRRTGPAQHADRLRRGRSRRPRRIRAPSALPRRQRRMARPDRHCELQLGDREFQSPHSRAARPQPGDAALRRGGRGERARGGRRAQAARPADRSAKRPDQRRSRPGRRHPSQRRAGRPQQPDAPHR